MPLQPMSPERWAQVEKLYHAVLEHDPGISARLLEQADPALRREVESLLAQHSQPLKSPAIEFAADLLQESTVTSFAPGFELGPYRIEAALGTGGMSEVWKARDTRLNRFVAIKKSHARFSRRFAREAQAIAALNHPHVCQIFDVGPDYLVLEYVDGTPLKGPLGIEETVQLAIQIASALEEAHSKGILHRDLKPGNIMVTASGTVKVLDFGIARIEAPLLHPDATAMTEPGVAIGTPAYMSPEQAQGHAVDARSDIFSFGLVLYTMASGRRAFTGDTLFELLTALVRDDPAPLDAPPALKRVVLCCLAKQPSERFQTMGEVRAALQQVLPERGGAKPEPEGPSIAVLPFANLSGDKEQEYFSDGLAEEIINTLAQFPGLKVTARTSAFAFRGKEQDITRIAAELRVRTILEGSVRKAGNRIRVIAQLINAADGYHLWSQRYDRELESVFAVQDEIAGAIAGALQVTLSVQPALRRNYTPNLPAYEAFLRGRHQQSKLTFESLVLCREYLEQAIALDPRFALPHCELALYYRNLAIVSAMPAHTAMPKARAAARKALEIDPSLPEAHAALGAVSAEYDYDRKEAEREFGMAMTQDKVAPYVRVLYSSSHLIATGRFGEAVRQMELALNDDPVNTNVCFWLALCRFIAGQYEEAVAGFLQTQELDRNFAPGYGWLAACYFTQRRFIEALANVERWHQLLPEHLDCLGWLAAFLTLTGDTARAQELVQRLLPGDAYGAPVGLYYFNLFCGNIDEAANWMEKSIEQRNPVLASYVLHPAANLLRKSPRWPALARIMNLPGDI